MASRIEHWPRHGHSPRGSWTEQTPESAALASLAPRRKRPGLRSMNRCDGGETPRARAESLLRAGPGVGQTLPVLFVSSAQGGRQRAGPGLGAAGYKSSRHFLTAPNVTVLPQGHVS